MALLDAIKSLGLTTTAGEVNEAVKEKFPGGTSGKEHFRKYRNWYSQEILAHVDAVGQAKT